MTTASFKVLSHHLPTEIKENNENLSRYLESKQRIKPRTSQYKAGVVTIRP
jgi:hypothetical protein